MHTEEKRKISSLPMRQLAPFGNWQYNSVQYFTTRCQRISLYVPAKRNRLPAGPPEASSEAALNLHCARQNRTIALFGEIQSAIFWSLRPLDELQL